MNESWRTIPGFEAYQVSSLGRVRRVRSGKGARPGRVLKLKRKKGRPHLYADLQSGGVASRIGVHRLMALAFLGAPPTTKHQAAHWNGRGDDNRIDNIRWATPTENALDKHRHGTDRRGERHPLVKLTAAQVIEIRERYARGERFTQLAASFGVTGAAISDICKGRRWSHIPLRHAA